MTDRLAQLLIDLDRFADPDDIRERFYEVAGAALNDGATQAQADAKAEAIVRRAVKDGRLKGSGVPRR